MAVEGFGTLSRSFVTQIECDPTKGKAMPTTPCNPGQHNMNTIATLDSIFLQCADCGTRDAIFVTVDDNTSCHECYDDWGPEVGPSYF